MRQRTAVAVVLALFIVGGACWWFASSRGQPRSAESAAAARDRGENTTEPVDPKAYAELNASSGTAAADVAIVESLLTNYLQSIRSTSSVPLGTNEEITRALSGSNADQLVFLPARHPAIDARRRLCDRWGTPYFFHQQSSSLIEVRSAGPDKKLFTNDDVLSVPRS